MNARRELEKLRSQVDDLRRQGQAAPRDLLAEAQSEADASARGPVTIVLDRDWFGEGMRPPGTQHLPRFRVLGPDDWYVHGDPDVKPA
jgi:hypothetical protein